MNDLVATKQSTALDAPRPIYPHDYDSAWRMAIAISKSGLAPKNITTPEAIFTAMQLGAEVGLSPMSALQNIAVVNGRPTIWGDAQLALVRASGLLEDFVETLEGDGEDMKAVCVAKRKGYSTPSRAEFSVTDARKAKLWGKDGPWQTNPKRMLQMRARAFALRDGFTDILKGIYSTEEARDIIPVHETAMATSDELNREFLNTGNAVIIEQAAEPQAESATPVSAKGQAQEAEPPAPATQQEKPVSTDSVPVPKGDALAERKKSAQKLIDDLQAAESADERDEMLAKAGGQNFLMALNKDGNYEMVTTIKRLAGLN